MSAVAPIFIELSRSHVGEVENDTVRRTNHGMATTLLYARHRKCNEDGSAFFVMARRGHDPSERLLENLSSSCKKLQAFAIRADTVFSHSGILYCGFCVVKKGVAVARLHNIQPNTPYRVIISFVVGAQCLGERPFVDTVLLRELAEKKERPLCAVVRCLPHSPWADTSTPPLLLIQALAQNYCSFLARTAHESCLLAPLLIHAVTDPKCVQYVALVQACRDTVTSFRIDGSAKQKSPMRIRSSPLQAPVVNNTDSAAILDVMTALSGGPSSVHGPWLLDWFDFLLLCLCPGSYPRIQQLARQMKALSVDEAPSLLARLRSMVRPEDVKIPAVSTRVPSWHGLAYKNLDYNLYKNQIIVIIALLYNKL